MKRIMQLFLALTVALFFCSTMPAMAKSSSKSETIKTSKSTKSSTGKSSSKKSRKKKSSRKKSTKSTKSTKNLPKININKASAEDLTEITGIGPKTAKKIIAYRKKHGKFKNADDLLNVKGIGEKTLQKMKGQLKF